MSDNFGWQGKLSDFLQTENHSILDALQNNEREKFEREPNSLQISAWKNCINILKEQLEILVSIQNDSKKMAHNF